MSSKFLSLRIECNFHRYDLDSRLPIHERVVYACLDQRHRGRVSRLEDESDSARRRNPDA